MGDFLPQGARPVPLAIACGANELCFFRRASWMVVAYCHIVARWGPGTLVTSCAGAFESRRREICGSERCAALRLRWSARSPGRESKESDP